jgi:uncharacterized protein YqgV (UPF0045/DUF77 family)
MALRAEFTIEPFHEGRPGPHVQAAVDALEAAGFTVDVGPFGSAIDGADLEVVEAVRALTAAALAAGATRVSVQVERIAAE